MPYDVYLAKERIHNLYNSFCNTSSTKKSVEVSIGSSLFSGKYSHETNSDTNIHTELDVIMRNINAVPVTDQHLPEEDELYITMTMPMSWNCQNRIDSRISSTFWIGSIRHTDSPFFNETKILLIGSEHNIIGNDNSGNYLSTSYTSAFFKSLEDTIDNDTFETSYFGSSKSLKDEWALFDSLSKESETSPAAASSLNRFYNDEWCYARYIEELYNNYSGNLCEYTFVAQKLDSALYFLDKKTPPKRFIIAAPLFVRKTRNIENRIILTPDGKRKLCLTSEEFYAHKQDAFKKLSGLLLYYHFIEEESFFTSRIKDLYTQLGKDAIFKNSDLEKAFINKAEPIVLDYFYVFPSINK